MHLKKCQFFQSKINFLGHCISGNRISTDPDKIAALQQCLRPHLLRELQSFLGLCNYYSKFVKEYATLAAPLTDLLKCFNPPARKKTPPLPWQEESHKESFVEQLLSWEQCSESSSWNSLVLLLPDAGGWSAMSLALLSAILGQAVEERRERLCVGERR